MIVYKLDILSELKEKGYTTYRIEKEKLFGQATIQKIRRNEIVNANNLNKLCQLLDCQPGDILEYVPDVPDLDTPEITTNRCNRYGTNTSNNGMIILDNMEMSGKEKQEWFQRDILGIGNKE